MARRISVAAAVDRDITAIAGSDKDLKNGGLAATALALARELDAKDTPASAKANCAARLRETLDALRRRAAEKQLDRLRDQVYAEPEKPEEEKSSVTDLRTRRAQRLAGGSDS